MSDEISVKAQMIKAMTTKDGALRITMDVFGADKLQVAYMTDLAMNQEVIEFTPKVSSD